MVGTDVIANHCMYLGQAVSSTPEGSVTTSMVAEIGVHGVFKVLGKYISTREFHGSRNSPLFHHHRFAWISAMHT